MKVCILLAGERHELEMDEGSSIEDAIRSLGGYPDAHLFLRDGSPVPMTLPLQDGIEIEARRIASKG